MKLSKTFTKSRKNLSKSLPEHSNGPDIISTPVWGCLSPHFDLSTIIVNPLFSGFLEWIPSGVISSNCYSIFFSTFQERCILEFVCVLNFFILSSHCIVCKSGYRICFKVIQSQSLKEVFSSYPGSLWEAFGIWIPEFAL